MSVSPVPCLQGLRALCCAAPAWLAGACRACPLNLKNTVMRSVVQEQVAGGTRHVIVHLATGPVLDERHLVRNDTGQPDALAHATLSQVRDDSHQDLGSADHDRFHLRPDPPREVGCRFGRWAVGDGVTGRARSINLRVVEACV